jgi:hypothetical protein
MAVVRRRHDEVSLEAQHFQKFRSEIMPGEIWNGQRNKIMKKDN